MLCILYVIFCILLIPLIETCTIVFVTHLNISVKPEIIKCTYYYGNYD